MTTVVCGNSADELSVGDIVTLVYYTDATCVVQILKPLPTGFYVNAPDAGDAIEALEAQGYIKKLPELKLELFEVDTADMANYPNALVIPGVPDDAD